MFRATGQQFRGKSLHPEKRIKKWNILKGDTVQVIKAYSESDIGKKGKVLKVLRKNNRLVVEGVNITKRHNREMSRTKAPGDYWHAPSPIHYSNVALLDPSTGKPTKISTRTEVKQVDGKNVVVKYRVARKTGVVIEKPPPQINLEKRKRVSPKDTPSEIALKKTFQPDTLNPLKSISLEHKEIFLKQEE